MLPSIIRRVPVKNGRSHMRTIDGPANRDKAPVVERVTRGQVKHMDPEVLEEWKRKSINNILDVETAGAKSPGKGKGATPTQKDSIMKFLNKRPVGPSSEAGPSSAGAVTAGSPKKGKKQKKSPTTPEGMTPSKRDGKVAAYLAFSPWA